MILMCGVITPNLFIKFAVNTLKTTINFDGSERHCKELFTLLQLQTPGIFHQNVKLSDALNTDGTKSGFKPLI